MRRPLLAGIVVVALAIAPALAAQSKTTSKDVAKAEAKVASLKAAKATYPPAVSHTASEKANKELAAAQRDAKEADEQVTSIAKGIRQQAESAPEFQEARSALNKAQSEYEAAKLPVLESLKDRPEYKAAVEARAAAERDRNRLRDEPTSTSPEQVTAAATAVMEASSAVTKMEGAAIAADPAASAARTRMTDASAKLTELSRQAEARVAADPTWQKARRDREAARQKASAASSTLSAALARESQQEKDRQKQVAAIDKARQDAIDQAIADANTAKANAKK